jgi:hypothetical protein
VPSFESNVVVAMSAASPPICHRVGSAAVAGGANADDLFADDDGDQDDLDALLPSDTHAALQFLLNQFPAVGGLSRFPLVLQHTLYTIVHDRGKVDRELDHLLRDGKIRRFDAATGPGQAFVALSLDYHKELARWCAMKEGFHNQGEAGSVGYTGAAVGGGGGGGTSSSSSSSVSSSPSDGAASSSSSSSADAAGTADDFDFGRPGPHLDTPPPPPPPSLQVRFCKIAQETRSMSITRLELERRLGEGGAAGNGGKAIDVLLRNLVSERLLTHQTQNISVESYFFSVPGTGLVVKNIIAGRKELLAVLEKKKYREMLRSKIVARRLTKTCFRTDTVLRDLTGSGLVLPVSTTSGALIRLIGRKKGKGKRRR